MAPGAGANDIYSATYSGVPVFEYNIEGNHVMRRRIDNYINATHILKVADYDKPARTRILERVVQKGVHEKVQGGYGKYQGTWVPLSEGKILAERNGVLDKLRPIFDYVPGDTSPPPAPKHTTNSNKPRTQKQSNAKKPQMNPSYSQMSEDYDDVSNQLHDDDSLDNITIASQSFMDEDDVYGAQYHQNGPQFSRKRKRGRESASDQEHMFWADQLLDYFILSATDMPYGVHSPRIPDHFEINRPIDDQNHTGLHWAACMGDIDIVRNFLDRGADPFSRNIRGETPLIRAVHFTNNHEKGTMPKLLHQLLPTMKQADSHGATILHHIAMTTSSLAKKKCARYYLDVVLNKLADSSNPQEISNFLNHQDGNGDTALHIVARHNAKKCIRALQGRGVQGDMYNRVNETADQIMHKTRSVHHDFLSSSPAPPLAGALNGHEVVKASKPNGVNPYHSQSAQSFSQSFGSIAQDKGLQVALAFESEVREKDDDLSESQRMQLHVENERHQTRQSFLRHMGVDFDDSNEEEDLMKQEEEQRLEMESKSLSEQIQHKDLHHAIRSEEHNLPLSAHQKINGIVSDEREVEEQALAAYALAAEQNKRRKLTTALVAAEGAAGMSVYGEKLKCLVSHTCGVPVEEVTALAPELLDELQQSKMEVGSEVAMLA